jgi:cell division protein FtsN
MNAIGWRMQKQSGGVFLGLIIGLVIGLGIALSVAIYVTKVPVPFVNKGQSRTADQDEAEARKNKNWDPNAPLYGKNPAKAVPPTTVPETSTKDPVPQSSKPESNPVEPKPATKTQGSNTGSDPLGDLVKSKTDQSAAKADTKTDAAAEAFTYFIQLGAFDKPEAAEARRAELSLNGIDAKVSEREQSGKTIYRVRVGPFESLEESNRGKDKLEKAGVKETALVRIKK